MSVVSIEVVIDVVLVDDISQRCSSVKRTDPRTNPRGTAQASLTGCRTLRLSGICWKDIRVQCLDSKSVLKVREEFSGQ